MIATNKPDRCPICGYYLTTLAEFAGSRCVDPGHWQAAGALSPRDYFPMAQIASQASVEYHHRVTNQNSLKSICC
ncbi:MAG: hypothetical protein JXM69_05625 [Anaerolineae bacterium]|nr:hypothetical protein [Anaerolineae bacterium]